jgi:hypothetical protein
MNMKITLHSEERSLNEGREEKIPRRNLTANRGDIVESAKRYPVVEP